MNRLVKAELQCGPTPGTNSLPLRPSILNTPNTFLPLGGERVV